MCALPQIPIPEVARLRTGQTWTVRDLEVPCEGCVPLPGPMSPALDMSIILQRCVLPCSSAKAWDIHVARDIHVESSFAGAVLQRMRVYAA